jgi:phosphoserine phosphatase RsbU/P
VSGSAVPTGEAPPRASARVRRRAAGPWLKRWWRWCLSVVRSGRGIPLDASAAAQPAEARARQVLALALFAVITAVALAQFGVGGVLIAVAWLAVGPLVASLVLPPRLTAVLAGWAVLAGLGLSVSGPSRPGGLVSHLLVLVLLAAFAVVNSALRTAAQRRLRQVRAVARVAQSALLRPVPATVTAGRLASRYVSAADEARVGGDLLEVVSGGASPRWLIGDTRGKGLPAVRLASVAMTSFRDACAQPGLSLPEIARVVDQSVARAAGQEDFVTAVFAEYDPRGWLQLVICGHPPPMRLTPEGRLQPLTPDAYATPLGLRPDIRASTFTVSPGDRLVFYTDGLIEARDPAGRFFQLSDGLAALRRPSLESAADELLARLRAHTGRKLDDDVALLLFEATSPLARRGDDAIAGPAPARGTRPHGGRLVTAGSAVMTRGEPG